MSNYYNRQWRLPNNENKDKQSNYSMDFDGTQLVSQGVGNFTSFNGVSECSVSLWFKSSTSQGPYKWFFNVPKNTTGSHGFGIYATGTGLTSHVYTSSLVEVVINFSGSQWDGNWHHLVLTYKDGVGLRFYYDSVLQFTNNTMSGTITAGGEELAIGGFSQSFLTSGIIAQLDGVSAFTYALSQSQITTLYGSSSTGIGNPMSLSPKPVFYAPLGDQDAFNGAEYLTPNASLKDFVFDTNGNTSRYFNFPKTSVGSDDFTFSFWVKPESYACSSTCGNTLLGNTNGTPSANQWNMWIYENDGKIRLVWYNQTSDAGNFMVTDFSFGAGTVNQEWVQVVLTRVGTTVTFYFNGVVDTATAGTLSSTSITLDDSSNATMRLPSPWGAPLYNQDGFYSNLLWHNVGLSSSEVITLYNSGSPIQTLSNIPQNSNLQGWWKLDASATYDSSTTTWSIPDSSSNSNTGTSSGMTQANLIQSDLSFTSGYSPYALDFDRGSSDSIDVNMDLSSFSSITVSTWAKFNSTTGYQYVYSAGTGSVAGDMLGIGKWDGTTEIYSFDRANVNRTGVSVTLNTWNHILVTHTGTTRKVYLNGSLIGTFTSGNLNLNSINFIGRYSFSASNYMDGSISNVSIWNAALTSLQVTEIYSEGIPQNLNNHSAYSNLVSWWQLGSNSSFNTNWTVLDEKGTNNGTSVNMIESDIVDGVNSYANGLSSGMGGDEVIGDAPYSTANSLSVNMDVEDRVTDTPN